MKFSILALLSCALTFKKFGKSVKQGGDGVDGQCVHGVGNEVVAEADERGETPTVLPLIGLTLGQKILRHFQT